MSDIDEGDTIVQDDAQTDSDKSTEPDEDDEEADAMEDVEETPGAPPQSDIRIEIYAPPKEEYKTSNVLSAFEMAEIVGIRSAQIAKNRICLVDVADLNDAVSMAKRELMMRKCPLTLRRYCGKIDGKIIYEYWNPNEMVFAVSW